MAKSRSPGSSSFLRKPAKAALKRLQEIASSEIIQKIVTALGPDSALHLVGGIVRDTLSGHEQTDIDLATALSPKECGQKLTQAHIRVVETGIQHGTILAVVDGTHIEITTFRTPGSREQFLPSGSIEEDLQGRDFTLNAIAYSIFNQALVDPLAGASDLKKGILRAVGDPARRFMEDPHRILRMVRFGYAAGRQVDKATEQAARAQAPEVAKVSSERVRDELVKILLSKFPSAGIRALEQLGLLEKILPEALPSVGLEQNEFHKEDVFSHTLSVLERSPADKIIRLAALFHDFGKPATLSTDEKGRRHFYLHEEISTQLCRQAMERLHFGNDEIKDVSLLVNYHMRPIECGPPGVRRLIRDLGPLFASWRELKRADKTPTMDEADFNQRLATFDAMVEEERNRTVGSPFQSLAIDGNDLLALGINPGPKVGIILKTLHEKVLDDPSLNTKESLLKIARGLI